MRSTPSRTTWPKAYVHADILWRATLTRAAEISRAHTAALGCRTLDVLHVATALELGLRVFVTFDRRQRQLAKATGLKPTPARESDRVARHKACDVITSRPAGGPA
jgi:hypothetical protein